jgi:putative aldouronate transport system permease protein
LKRFNSRATTVSGAVFDAFNVLFMIFMILITAYPLLYVLFASVSMPTELDKHVGAILYPLGFTLDGYAKVFSFPYIATGYRNTVFYVLAGTMLNIFMTSVTAYALSRKGYLLRMPLLMLITFTMFFSGGMIPMFLIMKTLGLYNNMLAMVVPGAISVWNLFVMKTSFEAVPASLEESAKLDGANDILIFWKIVLPLSMPTVAVMILFYGVGHWNAWFNAVLYLRDRNLYPLQLFMREILIISDTTDAAKDMMTNPESQMYARLVKYCVIIVSTVPILCVYPFLQKYFVKGVMVGAVKG